MPMRRIGEVVRGQQILTADETTSVLEASKKMAAARVGAIMIVSKGQLSGIFTERDALVRVLAEHLDSATTRLADVMTRNPQTISPDRPLGHAMHVMHDNGFRHLPVVQAGKPIGMVSARDALGLEMVAFEAELEQRNDLSERL